MSRSVTGASGRTRVLHVVTRLACGGLEAIIVNLTRGLEQQGFDQEIYCLAERGEFADQIPHSIPVRAGALARDARWDLSRVIRSWRPDVIHVQNGWAWPTTVLSWLLSGRWRTPVAFTIHGWDRRDALPPALARRYRLLAHLTPALAAVSPETAQQFAAETGIPARRFEILDAGVDTARFRPADRPVARGRFVLGCVGRLDPIKDHTSLLAAFDTLVKRGRHDLELRLIGDGPTRAALEQRVAELGLHDRVRFLGTVFDIPDQLRALDVFVLVSHREGRPVSIMEAMATGLPTIASSVGSVPGLVRDGRTGILVDAGDTAGLVAAIDRIASDAELRRTLGAEARRVAVAEISLEHMVEQYADFYRSLAARRARRGVQSGAAAIGVEP